MAAISKRGRKYIVRWRDPDGVQRTRTCPDHETARQLARDVEQTVSLGRRWDPEDAHPLPSLMELDEHGDAIGGLFPDFLAAARGRYAADSVRHYDHALRRFLAHLKRGRRGRLTVDLLTRDAVEAWFGELRQTLAVATARLRVAAVYAAWEWAEDSDKYGEHVGRPRRFAMPTPARTPAAAPDWAQMDQAIAAAQAFADAAKISTWREGWTWRARLLTLLRFTGLRANEQAMQLLWSDVHLEAGELVIRGELGKSRRERAGRVIPLAPALVEIMSEWGPREGFLLGPAHTCRKSSSRHIADCWRAAGVPEHVWAAGARGHGSPHHAFRRGFKTGLARLGVTQDVRDYLVGHHRGVDEHYLDTYAQAREALRRLPPLSCDRSVINLERERLKRKAASSS